MSRKNKSKASSSGVDPTHPPTVYISKQIDVGSLPNAEAFKTELLEWRQEIASKRTFLGKGLLPQQVARPRIIELVLIADPYTRCTVYFKEDNLYGIGFKNMLNTIYEVLGSKHLDGSAPLTFGHRYEAMMAKANSGKLIHVPLDKDHLISAIRTLSKISTMNQYAFAMLKIVLMVSESLRLNPIMEHVHDNFTEFYTSGFIMDPLEDDWMLNMVQKWSKMCRILKEYQHNPGAAEALEKIRGLNLRWAGETLVTYEDLEGAVGLILD